MTYVPGMLRLEVAAETRYQFRGLELVALNPADDLAKAAVSISLWMQGGDQVWLEQDVVPPPGAIDSLLLCPEPWCGHRLWVGRRYEPATLGLVKLSAELRIRHRRLALEALAGKPWVSVDQLLRRALEAKGERWHEHTPPACHLHDYEGTADLRNDPLRLQVEPNDTGASRSRPDPVVDL